MSAPSGPMRVASWLVHSSGGFCEWLASIESRTANDSIAAVAVHAPVFVAGLARSGSTILLEALASTSSFASLRYCDYPAVWFPWWWTHLRSRLPLPKPAPEQRAHRDRIAVTPESPEAFDEVFWMHFFAGRHEAGTDQRLDAAITNPRFEAFYTLQIRKLLAARGRARYLCKGNYNLARLAYLKRLFPDARFVIPVRNPLAHVSSLIKQHRLFCELTRASPSVSSHLERTGHFEFGPQRRAECLGDVAEAQRITRDFARGDDASGYARQWAMSYGAALDELQRMPELAAASLLLRYEDLCSDPMATLQRLATHCQLDDASEQALVDSWSARLSAPDYYQPAVGAEQHAQIESICGPTAARLGYVASAGRDGD